MYVYFGKDGRIKEIINDSAIRQGSHNYNTIHCYFDGYDEVIVNSVTIDLLFADGTSSNGNLMSTAEKIVYQEIPYDKNRDLKYFEDYKEYKFYTYALSGEDLNRSGVVKATVSLYADEYIAAQGIILFNIEESAIKQTTALNKSQYDVLMAEVGKIASGMVTQFRGNVNDTKFPTVKAVVDYLEIVLTDGIANVVFYTITTELLSVSEIADVDTADISSLKVNTEITIPSPTKSNHATTKEFVELDNDNLDLQFDGPTGVLNLLYKGNVISSIDLPTELIVSSGNYDDVNKKIVLVLANGQTIEIPIDRLVDVYNGSQSATISVSVVDKVIRASLLSNSVSLTHLNSELTNIINGLVQEMENKASKTELETKLNRPTINATEDNMVLSSSGGNSRWNKLATINGQSLFNGGDIKVSTSEGSNVTVDTEMSDTSENPVQNKVVKKYVDDSTTDMIFKDTVSEDTTQELKEIEIGGDKWRLPGGAGGGIIDVEELPNENFNDKVIYRLPNGELFEYDPIEKNFIQILNDKNLESIKEIIEVDELPLLEDKPESCYIYSPLGINTVNPYAQIRILTLDKLPDLSQTFTDNELENNNIGICCYTNGILYYFDYDSKTWNNINTLPGFKGYIDNISEGSFNLDGDDFIDSFYVVKVAKKVKEEYDYNKLYRIKETRCSIVYNYPRLIIEELMYKAMWEIIPCKNLPTIGKPVMNYFSIISGEDTPMTVYYEESSKSLKVYVPKIMAEGVGIENEGWFDAFALMSASEIEIKGIIYNRKELEDKEEGVYLLVETENNIYEIDNVNKIYNRLNGNNSVNIPANLESTILVLDDEQVKKIKYGTNVELNTTMIRPFTLSNSLFEQGRKVFSCSYLDFFSYETLNTTFINVDLILGLASIQFHSTTTPKLTIMRDRLGIGTEPEPGMAVTHYSSVPIDQVPTNNSINLINSGGVKAYVDSQIGSINTILDEILGEGE